MESTRSNRGTFHPVFPCRTLWPRGPEITFISPGEAETKLAQQGKTVTRALNLQEEWAKATGKKARFPMAGLVVPGKVADANPALIPAVRKEVAATIAKANAGDEQTLQKIADHYKLPVGVVKQVIPRLQLDMAPAAQTRSEYEDFLKRIGEGNPAIYGGKLPNAKFYAK